MKTISVRVDEVMTKETAIEETTNILSRSLTFEDCPPLENEEELDEPSVESVIERELEDEDEDDEVDVEIQRVSQIRDDDVQIERPSSRADELGNGKLYSLIFWHTQNQENPSQWMTWSISSVRQLTGPRSRRRLPLTRMSNGSSRHLHRYFSQFQRDIMVWLL